MQVNLFVVGDGIDRFGPFTKVTVNADEVVCVGRYRYGDVTFNCNDIGEWWLDRENGFWFSLEIETEITQ